MNCVFIHVDGGSSSSSSVVLNKYHTSSTLCPILKRKDTHMRPSSVLLQISKTAKAIKQQPLVVVSSIGNPEPQYSHTRHSIGHEVLNELIPRNKFSSSPWPNCNMYRGSSSEDAIFLQTTGYMNLSGQYLRKPWLSIRKEFPDREVRFVVLYDEMDKPLGKYQLRYGKVSSRGHNGLKDIVNKYGNDFYRLGVGIGRPESRKPDDVVNYVLSKIPRKDWEIIKTSVIPDVLEIIRGLRK